MVSVFCTVYNHEKYLRKCLEGFVMQKTNFKFEVIVHDDASTDHSADIIREYEQKYPEIIRPIYQTENQYSQKVGITKTFMMPLARGKYFANCEGDDYWCDENKLQMQFDIMEAHPDCHLCVHRVHGISEAGKLLNKEFPADSVSVKEGVISTEDFLKIILRTYAFQTSSYFRRMEDVIEYLQNPPQFKIVSDVGDEPILLYFALLGNVYYIDRAMSCYRLLSVGSWSSKQARDMNKRISHFKSMVQMYDLFDEYTAHKYENLVKPKRDSMYWGKYCIDLDNRENARILCRKEARGFFRSLSMKTKIYILSKAYAPIIVDIYYKIKGIFQ
jgi:glycosyltransferase involved in cell wall biosynthesis